MRAIQIESYDGPAAVRLRDIPPPRDDGSSVRITVHAAGVAFPEVLQSSGRYQLQPDLPFVPGTEIAGVIEAAPDGSGFAPGDRVYAWCRLGGFAETAVAATEATFPLPDGFGFTEGAGLFLNYHTAYFALVDRGRALSGETVLIHGAAGGVGTATIQVASALGLRPIALVSTPEKAEIARRAGATDVVLGTAGWKDRVLELVPGGVDLVVDVVGDEVVDSLRALRDTGRLLIVGFAGGRIPEVKVNRLLLRNLEVIGVGYGTAALADPAVTSSIARALDGMVRSGAIRPVIGAELPLEKAAEALTLLDSRRAQGKVVLRVREGD
ncbi:NADPH:quinone oxidoreductase family protein [Microbacterium sp.]|uniref:NADPH:quinone oxidoreductase family protein n=1 Tax=Microbacterium sp. TaxID=51671 RepID=UPI0037CAC3B7